MLRGSREGLLLVPMTGEDVRQAVRTGVTAERGRGNLPILEGGRSSRPRRIWVVTWLTRREALGESALVPCAR
jgi:hypothetical protein